MPKLSLELMDRWSADRPLWLRKSKGASESAEEQGSPTRMPLHTNAMELFRGGMNALQKASKKFFSGELGGL